MRLIPILAIITLAACSNTTTQTQHLPISLDGVPSISSHGFPSYKTATIPAPFEIVKTAILKSAKNEGFDRIETIDKYTIIVGGRVNAEDSQEERNAKALATVVTVPLVVLMLAAGVAPSFDTDQTETPLYQSAIYGRAKLRDLGANTEVSLNFNRVLYKRTREDFRFSDLLTAASGKDLWEYKPDVIDQIDEPEIYEYAFKRLQGLPAELPKRKILVN
ncbi:MAG: hypothetical protein QF872_01655 [Gammaproteobacteria bacterium]|jgi:hypothetical protein|nr:hypothetical protein [Gammaproteobacteria bacterium]